MSELRLIAPTLVDPFLFKALPCYDEEAADRVCRNLASGSVLEAYTIVNKEHKVIGIIGANLMFPHSATYWALFSEQIKEYPKSIHKILLAMIDRNLQHHKLKRVQTFIDTDNVAAIRHNERMGFVREGYLKAFGPGGKDQYIYAKVVG